MGGETILTQDFMKEAIWVDQTENLETLNFPCITIPASVSFNYASFFFGAPALIF